MNITQKIGTGQYKWDIHLNQENGNMSKDMDFSNLLKYLHMILLKN